MLLSRYKDKTNYRSGQWHSRSVAGTKMKESDLRGSAAFSQGHLKPPFSYNDLCFWACYFGPLGITAHTAVSRLILWLEADKTRFNPSRAATPPHAFAKVFISQGRRVNMHRAAEWTNEKMRFGRWSGFCGFRQCPWTLERVSCWSKRFKGCKVFSFLFWHPRN